MRALLEYKNEMGAAYFSDMKFLIEEDLGYILPTLQCRKLISFIKNKENKPQSNHGTVLVQNDTCMFSQKVINLVYCEK